jgi:hypothetical protein
MTARLWPLLAWSPCAQPATVLAGTLGEGAVLASFHLVGMDLASHSTGGPDR